jgi:large repetitive protein
MRPVRIIATVAFAAALAVTGCASRSADQTGASSSGASSVTTTQPTASTSSTTTTLTSPATATCVVAPKTGPAGARVTLTCRGFAPGEQVAVTFGAVVVATAKATAGGEAAASFAVPSGFAGSHYPGRKDTFQAKGRQSGKVASATFTVTG